MPLTVWKCSTSKNVAIALSIIIREARTAVGETDLRAILRNLTDTATAAAAVPANDVVEDKYFKFADIVNTMGAECTAAAAARKAKAIAQLYTMWRPSSASREAGICTTTTTMTMTTTTTRGITSCAEPSRLRAAPIWLELRRLPQILLVLDLVFRT